MYMYISTIISIVVHAAIVYYTAPFMIIQAVTTLYEVVSPLDIHYKVVAHCGWL